jgi:hypothetical protein
VYKSIEIILIASSYFVDLCPRVKQINLTARGDSELAHKRQGSSRHLLTKIDEDGLSQPRASVLEPSIRSDGRLSVGP